MSERARVLALHGGLLVLLLALHFVLPPYHHGNLARIMVLASYAAGYNIVFGYTGLLSLGHALFFAAGMYAMGLSVPHIGTGTALLAGVAAGGIGAILLGLLALRTRGVAFMIVTLMFAQAGYLTILYFGAWTRGDEGFVIARASRMLWGLDLSDAAHRYLAALALFALVLGACLWMVRAPFGRSLIAIRENEPRAAMLGYDTFRLKLAAMAASGAISGAAGAAYALLFGYAGASFASVEYSILPLLWVLLGGAGTVLGPFIGTLFMFYLIDLSSGVTSAYMLIAGIALVLLTLFAPRGLMGTVRARLWRWLP
ncbi:branched-chain amino acid ABC transporter permease [Pelagivirga sediminicola]|uniref:Branched-chain amino acid ABC transporter permease n=1 Tax=Pelagivirga sediminicola TaxID=2170575 RepID=A0A2T7G6I3_9RHOB|nr:branched-chain amino acid ABC transporter permease [Pelagivirga sediminicola]PVA09987.1 branched-chain amino acid ABC transporter permease [Pelagivirga sediminicola]